MSIDIHIPGYELKRQAGKGGMATVYLAVQLNFGRDVALKIMAPHLHTDPDFATRFQREARIVSQMHHGNIVPVYDVGEHQGHEFLAMEFLSGGDLRSRIHPDMTWETALEICSTVAAALGYAHSKNILHRDVKPENILFREDGTPVLTDFGIARSADSGTMLTQTGVLVGTPAYMSPEQAKGQVLDGRTDLYSLGIVLYELLTGIQPYRADSAVSLLLKHVSEPVPVLPARLAHLQPFLERALAKNPAERYPTGAAMAQALQELLPARGGSSPVIGRGGNGRGDKGRGFSARAGVLIGGVSAAVIAAAALVMWPGSAPTPPMLSANTSASEPLPSTSAPSVPAVGAKPRDNSQVRTEPTAVASVPATVKPRTEPATQASVAEAASAPPTPSIRAPRAEPVSIQSAEAKTLPIAVTVPVEENIPEPSIARVLPNRTELWAAPVSEICEQTSRTDDPVEMRLARPVPLSDGSTIPADTVLTGRIAGKRLVGNQPPLVEIEADRLTMEGRTIAVTTNPFSFYMSRPSAGGRIVKGAVIGAAAGAVVGVILKKNVAAAAAGGAVVGGVIGAASRPPEACVSQSDTTFVFRVTSDTAIR